MKNPKSEERISVERKDTNLRNRSSLLSHSLFEFLRFSLFAISLLVMAPQLNAQSLELSGYLAAESRIFPQSPLLGEQYEVGNLSLSLQPEFYYEWSGGDQSILFVPFARLDQHNGERTHFDIREFYWQRVWHSFELSIGLRKIFWGVTESQHLVDIINQSDLVENLDTEDKLGQPMVNLTLIQNWGALDFFLMPYFRERPFLTNEARLRIPAPIDTDLTGYESNAEEKHLDWAVRWFHTLGIFDIGLSHFSGTSREPVIIPTINIIGAPFYHTIDQTGLDLQATTGGWLLKLEAINRFGQGDRFFATTAGFEYTFSNIRNSGIDVGLIMEYHYDERGKEGLAPFDDDIFFGSRLAFNDVQSTDILAGVIIDRDRRSSFLNLEASRRLGDRYKLEVEFRGFVNASSKDIFYGLRKDHYFQLELARYF
ncbi:hypothetical protein IH879_14935 [candidate division KSB1 bacterium]|nr:hypothetical protein [candidate division KSB1 bacterium]